MGRFSSPAYGGNIMIQNEPLSAMPSLVNAENDILGAILTNIKYYDEVKKYIKHLMYFTIHLIRIFG